MHGVSYMYHVGVPFGNKQHMYLEINLGAMSPDFPTAFGVVLFVGAGSRAHREKGRRQWIGPISNHREKERRQWAGPISKERSAQLGSKERSAHLGSPRDIKSTPSLLNKESRKPVGKLLNHNKPSQSTSWTRSSTNSSDGSRSGRSKDRSPSQLAACSTTTRIKLIHRNSTTHSGFVHP
ncbi:hypothetical protein V2J09_016720 [Rumex salicifolius]